MDLIRIYYSCGYTVDTTGTWWTFCPRCGCHVSHWEPLEQPLVETGCACCDGICGCACHEG